MRKILFAAVLSAATLVANTSSAQFSIAPLTGFGGADHWLYNGESIYLANDNLARGLAYGNGNLYLVSRTTGNNVRIIDPLTGADLGGLNLTGVSGGSGAVINAAAVGGDGAIYVGNLTVGSSTSPFKVYRWANNAAVPTVAYSGDPIGGAGRFGDNLAAFGSGASTRLAAGAGNTALTTDNSFALIDPTAGTGANVQVAGAAQGDFRLGITFTSSGDILGTQGSASGNGIRFTTQGGTLLGTSTASTSSQRPIGFSLLGGIGLLAAVDTVDGILRIYDATNPGVIGSPVLFGTALPAAHLANGNGTGAIAWGSQWWDGTKWNAYLYALESNNGIQAYIVSVPEPTSAALALLGGALLFSRARRKN
jgi:hypothetical protein